MKKVDANDVLRDVGPAGLRELIDKTPPKDLAAFNIVEAKPINLKSLRAFVAEYQPPSYVVEPIIRSGSLYTLTGKTGGGKTGLLVSTTLAVATGRQDILKLEVVKGRVAYLTAENPDDARMRFMVSCFVLNVGIDGIAERVVILDRREKPEDIVAGVTKFAEEEPFALIIVDTLAAFYDGKDINSSVEGGEFLRRLRPLTRIKGSPAVVVAAHPVKNADQNQLIPYGSGAILNEVDGNLTCWKQPETGLVSVHWQGKLRGLEFEPIIFRIEIVGSPDVLDAKGRQVQMPTLISSSAQAVEDRERDEAKVDRALLQAMIENPDQTQREWGTTVGRSKSVINRKLQKLGKKGLVSEALGRWEVTSKGRTATKNNTERG